MEKKTNPSSTHPLRFQNLLFSLSAGLAYWPGLPLSLQRPLHFPLCDPSSVFHGALVHIAEIMFD